ncbi:MAG: pyruvate formate lyase [Kiritimatiellaeota bacterium]|nr:pyruvate formate lyase [Kiritimatiellota bacterium]
MNERTERLRAHIHALNAAGVRRTTFYGLIDESLKATTGEPARIRRAKAFAHLLSRVDQVVLPHELVVGSILGMWPPARGLPSSEERLCEARALVAEFADSRRGRPREAWRRLAPRWALHRRDHYDASIPFEELQHTARRLAVEFEAEGLVTFAEIYRLLEDHFQFDYGADVRRRLQELPWFASNHLHLNYAKPLRLGLGGIRDRIKDKLAANAPPETRRFYEASYLAIQAAIAFVRRYAATVRQHAARCPDERRRAELGEMARIVEAVAEAPPLGFRAALQLTWLVHVIGNIGGGSALSFARLDQYLFPFYECDLQEGRITREQTRELLECVWLKVNEPHMRTVQSVCLGGLTPGGEDGVNDLTYLCLEVTAAVHEPYPNTCVRITARTPARLWRLVTDTICSGCGQPQLFNDEILIPGLVGIGYLREQARDYYPMGCVEIMIQGKSPTWSGTGREVVFPSLLELVFTNGAANMWGETGPATGELASFRTFDQFLAAYLQQIRHCVRDAVARSEANHEAMISHRFDPFASALVDGCIESGLDVEQGGAACPLIRSMGSRGIGTAIDALSAIKTFVFERGKLALDELRAILARNYEGAEDVRRLLANRTPAFGNDLAEVDAIAVAVYNAYADTLRETRSRHHCVYVPNMFSYNDHVRFGEWVAATANGRRRGEPISDALGPTQGKDAAGPTSLINSVTRFDFSKMTGGCAFNVKLNPAMIQGECGREKLTALLQTYMRKGGLQIQVNFVDQETLRAAQRAPDQYANLIVRVAGYCEYFCNLDRAIQDEIIARTSLAPSPAE